MTWKKEESESKSVRLCIFCLQCGLETSTVTVQYECLVSVLSWSINLYHSFLSQVTDLDSTFNTWQSCWKKNPQIYSCHPQSQLRTKEKLIHMLAVIFILFLRLSRSVSPVEQHWCDWGHVWFDHSFFFKTSLFVVIHIDWLFKDASGEICHIFTRLVWIDQGGGQVLFFLVSNCWRETVFNWNNQHPGWWGELLHGLQPTHLPSKFTIDFQLSFLSIIYPGVMSSGRCLGSQMQTKLLLWLIFRVTC